MSHTNLTILKIIQNQFKPTSADKKFMHFLQNNVSFVINNSIIQIAEASKVSESSISRFVQKSGFKNLNEMKLLLVHGQVSEQINKNKQTLLDQLTDDYIKLINDTSYLISSQQMTKLVNKILNSSRVKLYGVGSSGIVAQDISFRLSKIGIVATAYQESHYMKIDGALSKKDELAIGISLSGTSSDVYEAIHAAKQQGIFTVTVTNFQDILLTQMADFTITIPSKAHLELGNLISPQLAILLLFDYIIGEIIFTDRDRFFQTSSYVIHTLFGKNGQR